MAKRNLELCLSIATLCSACAVFLTIAMRQCKCWQRPLSARHQEPPRRLLTNMQPIPLAQNVSALLRTVIEGNISVKAQQHADRDQTQRTRIAGADTPTASAPQLAPARKPTGYTYDMAHWCSTAALCMRQQTDSHVTRAPRTPLKRTRVR